MRFFIAAAVAALCITGGSAPAPGPEPEFTGPPGSGKPNLATLADGRVVMTWLEPAGGDSHALRFAVRDQGRWGPPGTVLTRADLFVNWADFPSIVIASDGRWVVHYLQRTEERPYAYHVLLTASSDEGRTWSTPITAHSDQSPNEHGFVAMTAGSNGSVDLAWLDGRALAGPGMGNMTVRAGTLTADGRMVNERLIDDRTCECCQVAMARTTSGLVVAYRDRSDEEVRDIAVSRRVGGAWTAPTIVARDNWVHRACPVNGPALVAYENRVTLIWYTEGGGAHVWGTTSFDGGTTWSERARIDDGDPIGRIDAEVLGDGSTLVAWLEGTGRMTAEWRARRIARTGRPGASWMVAASARARPVGFPRLARSGADLLLAYTEPDGPGRVRVVRIAR